jgi:hypothetical protein
MADTGKCLDLVGGDTSNGTPIWLWDCNGFENQAWTFASDSWTIVYQADTSKCIDAGDMSDGKQLQSGIVTEWTSKSGDLMLTRAPSIWQVVQGMLPNAWTLLAVTHLLAMQSRFGIATERGISSGIHLPIVAELSRSPCSRTRTSALISLEVTRLMEQQCGYGIAMVWTASDGYLRLIAGRSNMLVTHQSA